MKKISIITIIFLGCLLGLNMPLSAQSTGTENGHEWVDLGLPSGLKWATCNVGASSPEKSGNYYAWGETKPKDEYEQANSVTYGKQMADISGNAQYDAATANWGEGWRIPTNAEMQELIDFCAWEWTTQNRIKGYNVTGPNGNSIFIPSTGYKTGSMFKGGTCDNGNCWSSKPNGSYGAYCFSINSSSHSVVSNGNREYGRTVRPVKSRVGMEIPCVTASIVEYTDISAIVNTYATDGGSEIIERGLYYGTNPDPSETDNKVVLENETRNISKMLFKLSPNTTYYVKAFATNSEGTSYSEIVSFTTLAEAIYREYVDLGLPSGLKWAAYNIGASSPEEYGNYYAWGEVAPKITYTQDNSLTYDIQMDDISGSEYDAAVCNWGGNWRMPTKTEMHELKNICVWEWTKQNGVNGYKVIGPNGNSIFLPAAGYHYEYYQGPVEVGNTGEYWNSTPSGICCAYYLSFNRYNTINISNNGRNIGKSVRPVLDVNNIVEVPFVSVSVEVTDITAIITSYAAGGGNDITERGFYWGTTLEFTETDNNVILDNNAGYMTEVLMELTPNTTYYVKAYAANEAGISYSEVVSFTTKEETAYNDYVDLGLPSGLHWAAYNIGATTPEENGNYYAWGEVVTKNEYTDANCLTYGVQMSDISGTEYDAAAVNWGGEWRMPTKTEMDELKNNCTWEWIEYGDADYNGVEGYKVIGPNGNYIFFSKSVARNDKYYNNNTFYSCSTPYDGIYDVGDDNNAWGLLFSQYYYDDGSKYYYDIGATSRYIGASVRPVKDGDYIVEEPWLLASVESVTDITAIIKTYTTEGGSEITERGFYWGLSPDPTEYDNNVVLENKGGYIKSSLVNLEPNMTYYVKAYAANESGISYSEVVEFTTHKFTYYNDFVDLGLPSGLMWATCNVGATYPEDYGNYYAWGEVFTKDDYTEDNSETYGKNMGDISGTEYDAATVNWGGNWRMPTRIEMQELIDNCVWVWIIQNGVNGYKVIGPNGQHIFLPAAGYKTNGWGINNEGFSGEYRSSTPEGWDDSGIYAGVLYFNDEEFSPWYSGFRYYGCSIRPVRE